MTYPATDAQLSASNLQVLLHFLADDAPPVTRLPQTDSLRSAEASGSELQPCADAQKHGGEL